MLWNSSSAQSIEQLNANKRLGAEKRRKDIMSERSALLNGDWGHLVHNTLKSQFDDPRHVQILIDQSCNTFKRIIDEVYKHPGVKVREFQDATGTADPTFEALKEELSLDVQMQEVFRYMGAYNDCLVQVLHGDPKDEPYVRIFSPDEVTVECHPMYCDELVKVTYDTHDETGKDITVIWTNTEHYIEDDMGKKRVVPGAQDTINPYGFIPFVPVHGGLRSDYFWDSVTRTDLVDFTLKYAAAWSGINHNRHMQSFKQPVITNAKPGQKAPPRLGPDEMLVFEQSEITGQSAQLQAIDMSIDLNGIITSLQTQLGQKTAEYGLSGGAFLRTSTAPQSGFSRKLERQSLLDKREAAYPFLIEAEYDICEMIRAMWNFSNPGQLIPWEDEFVLILDAEPTEISPIEEQDIKLKKLDVIERQIALGLMSKVEALMTLEDITVEEATMRVAEIDALKAANTPIPPSGPVNPFASLMKPALPEIEAKGEGPISE